MSFPSNPIDGQTAIVNGITYVYNASNKSFTRVAQNVTATTTLSVTGTTPATSTATGALTVAGGVGIGGILDKDIELNIRYDLQTTSSSYLNQIASAKLKFYL